MLCHPYHPKGLKPSFRSQVVFSAALSVFLTDVLINEAPPCGLVALPSGQQKLGDSTSTGSLWSRLIQTKPRVRDSTLADPCLFNDKRSEETFRARKGVQLGRKWAAWVKRKCTDTCLPTLPAMNPRRNRRLRRLLMVFYDLPKYCLSP